jgi:membrane AbrB-like protein
MPAAPDPQSPALFEKLSAPAQWGVLLAVSAVLATVFELIGLPAALLIGPMIAGIVVGTNGGTIRGPRLPMLAAQAVVGCLVGRAMAGDIVHAFVMEWMLLLGVVLVIVAASGVMGWLLARFKVLPGTTAIWGTTPGAASAMMILSGAFGADARLVAFMQYLRVVIVAGLASVVARLWVGHSGLAMPGTVWFPAVAWPDFLGTMVLAAVFGAAGPLLRIPGGAMLLPMIAGAIAEGTGIVRITLPTWLLAASYAFLGWSIGLGFTRQILGHASRALPAVLLSIAAIIGLCAGLALLLVHAAGVDPLTAYLATSPGGMDAVAIIAASSDVDIAFVMALQGARLVVVLITGPPLARFIARHMT